MITNSTSSNEAKKVSIEFDLIVNVDAVAMDAKRIASAVLFHLQTVTLPEEPDTEFMQRWYATWAAILYMQASRFPSSKIKISFVITPNRIQHQTVGFGNGLDAPASWTPQEIEEAQSFVNSIPEENIEDDISNN